MQPMIGLLDVQSSVSPRADTADVGCKEHDVRS